MRFLIKFAFWISIVIYNLFAADTKNDVPAAGVAGQWQPPAHKKLTISINRCPNNVLDCSREPASQDTLKERDRVLVWRGTNKAALR